MLIPSPTSSEVQRARKEAKTIKTPILLCVTHSTLAIARQPHRHVTDRLVRPPGMGGHRWDNQLTARLADRFSESPWRLLR